MSALKYRNIPTEVDGSAFASKKEARRYGELTLLQRAGRITELVCHPSYPLDVNGHPICRYVADFRYRAADGTLIVEDVKSPATAKNPVYRLKNKLFAALYGIQITEV